MLGRIKALFTGFAQFDPLTMAIGAASLVVLFVGARLAPRLPWSLIVLVAASSRRRSSTWLLAEWRSSDLFRPVYPDSACRFVPVNRVVDVAFAGAALAFVGLAEGLSAARLFAVKGKYRVETDQELFAAGAANLASGFAGGLAVAGSLSKTAAVDRAGGKSQVAGLAAAAISIVVILFFAPTLSGLPTAVLSAIVVHAVWGLIDIPAIRRYRASRRIDLVAACAAAVGVLVAGPLLGLLLAVGLSILGLVYRSSRVTIDVMGKVPGEKAAWGALDNHAERITLPGILILRLNESLFWVNAARVHDEVLALADAFPDTRAIVLDLESTDQLEITSSDMLGMLMDRLRDRGIDLYLVQVRFRVRSVLKRTGVRERLGEDHLWHSVSQGVRSAREDHGLKPVRVPGAEPIVPDEVEEAAPPEDDLIIATSPVEVR